MTDNNADNSKPNGKAGSIHSFPDASERQRMEQEKASRSGPPKPPSEPILNLPSVIKLMILVLVLIHVGVQFLPVGADNLVYFYIAFIPNMYLTPFDFFPQVLTAPLTHAVLHGGWTHLIVNLTMLGAFGSGVVKEIGVKRFLAIFAFSTIAGAFTHLFLFWGSTSPLIGASGGISGLFGALLRILQDRGHMKAGWQGLMPITVLWVGVSILFAVMASVPGGEIAWTAHIGGFLAGMLVYPWVLRKIK